VTPRQGAPLHAGILGIAVGPLVRALFSFLTSWVSAGAASLVSTVGHAIEATSGPQLGGPLVVLMSRTTAIGLALSLPLLLLAIVQGVVRQEVGLAVRSFLLRVPVAALLSAGSLEVVRLAVQASDEMSAALLAAVSGPVDRLFNGLADGVVDTAGTAGFLVVLLAAAAAAVAFLLWAELVVRAAAIEVATLFLPLALAGLIWPATAHWARRLAETLGALVLAKVVIAGVLALSVATLGTATGTAAVVQGIALLALAGCAPYALLRLVPAVESGTIAHLEGLARRQLRAGASLVSSAATRLPDGAPEPWSADGLLPPPAERGSAQLDFPPARLDPVALAAELPEQLAFVASSRRSVPPGQDPDEPDPSGAGGDPVAPAAPGEGG
jgi:hypothetical protein